MYTPGPEGIRSTRSTSYTTVGEGERWSGLCQSSLKSAMDVGPCRQYTKFMPSRASMPKRPRDPNLLARSVVEDLIGEKMDGSPLDPKPLEREKNPAAVALSKLGASKGGKARAESLSARKRKMIAKKAAEARWSK